MQIDALDYQLPVERIATQPAEPRDSARLMVVNRRTGEIAHLTVSDLGRGGWFLRAGDLMVFNKTRVLPARFAAVRTATGGKITGLYLETIDQDHRLWRVLLESRGRLRRGETIAFDDCTGGAQLELLETETAGSWQARLHGPLSTDDLLVRIGSTPLPSYILQARKARGETPDDPRDTGRYNTVFAADPGSVAAPTAALHFTGPSPPHAKSSAIPSS